MKYVWPSRMKHGGKMFCEEYLPATIAAKEHLCRLKVAIGLLTEEQAMEAVETYRMSTVKYQQELLAKKSILNSIADTVRGWMQALRR